MATAVESKPKKPSTSHLKIVPETRAVRDQLRAAAHDFGKLVDRSKPLTRPDLQLMAEGLLRQLGLSESYLGFTMVAISNEFWREQVQAIPFNRRLLLLPHCLKNAEGCPADYDEFGLDCRKCGACSVADFKTKAEDLGYKVLVSEGTPIVLKIIVSGHVDAIVGVACLNVLEKAFDKILLAGVPCVAAPLLSSNCKSTSVDDDWVSELIDLHTPAPQARTKTYMHLMRAAHQLCEEPVLSRLAPRRLQIADRRLQIEEKNGHSANLQSAICNLQSNPLVQHEQIAYDWLAQGGKRSRPFITLAAYDAMKGAPATRSDGIELPDSVRRAALAIEAFHKASLVHDDIEDDDSYRYGQETLHRKHGIGTAINVGDYLIGLGYRLVARDRKELGGDVAADILNRLSEAHLKLAEGQGAELLWRDAADQTLTPLDALKIYALKTSPAFEAALYSGLRLAGPVDAYEKLVLEFSKNLGIAFQILNDLKDWQPDGDNKLLAGQDALSARPTLLLALALEGLKGGEREELLYLLEQSRKTPGAHAPGSPQLERVRRLFNAAGVFDKADKLVEKFTAKAEALADEVEPIELRELLYFLVDTVLERQTLPEAEPELHQLIPLTT